MSEFFKLYAVISNRNHVFWVALFIIPCFFIKFTKTFSLISDYFIVKVKLYNVWEFIFICSVFDIKIIKKLYLVHLIM